MPYSVVAGLLISFLTLCAVRNRRQGWRRDRGVDLLQFSESLRAVNATHTLKEDPAVRSESGTAAAGTQPEVASRMLTALHSAVAGDEYHRSSPSPSVSDLASPVSAAAERVHQPR